MVGSGRVQVGSGWPAILCVIFGLDRFFLVSGQIFQPVPDPSLGRVGSGRVFFGRVGSGLSGRVARDQV